MPECSVAFEVADRQGWPTVTAGLTGAEWPAETPLNTGGIAVLHSGYLSRIYSCLMNSRPISENPVTLFRTSSTVAGGGYRCVWGYKHPNGGEYGLKTNPERPSPLLKLFVVAARGANISAEQAAELDLIRRSTDAIEPAGGRMVELIRCFLRGSAKEGA